MREGLLAGLAFLLLGVASPAATEEAPGPASAARVPPTRADLDLHEIRNIFRYGDDPDPGPADSPGPAAERDAVEPADVSPAVASAGARLVGLVRRSDRLVAALAIDGEVVLLAEGESASGFTVLGVGNEAVELRGPEGHESTLRLP